MKEMISDEQRYYEKDIFNQVLDDLLASYPKEQPCLVVMFPDFVQVMPLCSSAVLDLREDVFKERFTTMHAEAVEQLEETGCDQGYLVAPMRQPEGRFVVPLIVEDQSLPPQPQPLLVKA